MPDQFTQVTTKGYGNRLMESIQGVVVGILLFFASFGLLYWNEGRTDTSNIAKTAVEVSADKAADSSLNGKLVSVTGNLTSSEMVGDKVSLSGAVTGDIVLKGGKYIAVSRNVEMYAWVENTKTSTQKNVGGSETSTTTYDYKKEWTSSPADSSKFAHPEEHLNPTPIIEGTTNKASAAKVGMYSLDLATVQLPGSTKIVLNKDNITIPGAVATGVAGIPATQGVSMVGADYVFVGKNYQAPTVGDVRISYSGVNADQKVTAFGQLDGTSISPYVDPQNNQLYRVFAGTKESAVATLHGEYSTLTWILRAVGFLMMWIGLSMLFGPITTLLDFLPILGDISGALIHIVTFVVALVLSIVTILVSMLLHSIVALVIAGVITIGVIGFFLFMAKQKKGAAKPAK